MTLQRRTRDISARRSMAFADSRKAILPLFSLLLLGLLVSTLASCTAESPNLGQFRKGRTLHFAVVSVERTPELRYATCDVLTGSNPPVCDPMGVERNWSIFPSSEDMELVLVRAKVQNHTAVSAFINVDRTGAELRDFGNAIYRPLYVSETAWRDFRGEPEALVRMDQGQCIDSRRSLIDAGSAVRWQNESDDAQYLAFDDSSVGVFPGERAEVPARESLSSTFDDPGMFAYSCGDSEADDFEAEVWVSGDESGSDYIQRKLQFIQGSFELVQGNGVDGYLVFEAPVGTEFRDMHWRAGDSIRFEF